MQRAELEHLIRACAQIADDDELVIVGSQAILAQYPDAPPAMLVSREADVYPRRYPERADVIDGSIGEGSLFHDTFGYYAHGVGPETIEAPAGWEQRLVPLSNQNTRGATGWCLEVHDLVLAKCAAGREKDWIFAEEAIRHGLVDRDVLFARLAQMPIDSVRKAELERLLAGRYEKREGGGRVS